MTKGPRLCNMDKFYVYKETKKVNQLNDKHTGGPSAVLLHNTYLNLPWLYIICHCVVFFQNEKVKAVFQYL